MENVIDDTPNPMHPMTCFGRMNEDIYDEVENVCLGKNGLITVIRTINPGDELLVKYDNEDLSSKSSYSWDWIKQESLSALSKKINTDFLLCFY